MRHNPQVQARYTFQDERRLYMAMDYCAGGDLWERIVRSGRLKESQVKFHTAEIVIALEHIHSMGAIYRDLKPSNCLLTASGHIKLTDFGTSKFDSHALSMVGTLDYMAPEIVMNQKYDASVDYWALGCVIFELLYGRSPFFHRDEAQVYTNIMDKEPAFDDEIATVSAACKDLISRLLHRDPKERLQSVRGHSFFQDVNWNAMDRLDVAPPWIPPLSGEDDTAHFAESMTREQIKETPDDPELLEGLTEEAQEAFHGFSFMASPAPIAAVADEDEMEDVYDDEYSDDMPCRCVPGIYVCFLHSDELLDEDVDEECETPAPIPKPPPLPPTATDAAIRSVKRWRTGVALIADAELKAQDAIEPTPEPAPEGPSADEIALAATARATEHAESTTQFITLSAEEAAKALRALAGPTHLRITGDDSDAQSGTISTGATSPMPDELEEVKAVEPVEPAEEIKPEAPATHVPLTFVDAFWSEQGCRRLSELNAHEAGFLETFCKFTVERGRVDEQHSKALARMAEHLTVPSGSLHAIIAAIDAEASLFTAVHSDHGRLLMEDHGREAIKWLHAHQAGARPLYQHSILNRTAQEKALNKQIKAMMKRKSGYDSAAAEFGRKSHKYETDSRAKASLDSKRRKYQHSMQSASARYRLELQNLDQRQQVYEESIKRSLDAIQALEEAQWLQIRAWLITRADGERKVAHAMSRVGNEITHAAAAARTKTLQWVEDGDEAGIAAIATVTAPRMDSVHNLIERLLVGHTLLERLVLHLKERAILQREHVHHLSRLVKQVPDVLSSLPAPLAASIGSAMNEVKVACSGHEAYAAGLAVVRDDLRQVLRSHTAKSTHYIKTAEARDRSQIRQVTRILGKLQKAQAAVVTANRAVDVAREKQAGSASKDKAAVVLFKQLTAAHKATDRARKWERTLLRVQTENNEQVVAMFRDGQKLEESLVSAVRMAAVRQGQLIGQMSLQLAQQATQLKEAAGSILPSTCVSGWGKDYGTGGPQEMIACGFQRHACDAVDEDKVERVDLDAIIGE